jgi:NADH/NAD ratio-sensing transcriptional regulator Rex
MAAYIARNDIRMAVLTTPVDVAQRVTDRLVAAGVRAIWNFTPTRLTVPPGVFVRNEHISLGLSELAYHLANDVAPPRAASRTVPAPARRRVRETPSVAVGV